MFRIIFVSILLFSAQIVYASHTAEAPQSEISIGTFTAKYYSENDGKNAGNGNDEISTFSQPKLLFTESVTRPSINYPYSDFHGIDSYNFLGVWEGNITAHSEGQTTQAHFNVSKGSVSFYVNGKQRDQWKDSDKTVEFNLQKGANHIRIELHNHWHTTNFNVSFSDYQHLNKSQMVDYFEKIDFKNTKTIYIGAYEAKDDPHNEILITLPQSPSPIYLFLNSYRAVNWIISNPHKTTVAGLGLRANSPGSTVANISPDLVHILPVDRGGYKSSHTVKAYTGKNADYAFTEYGINNLLIPNIFSAKIVDHSDEELENFSELSETNISIIPPDQFLETLIEKKDNLPITSRRLIDSPHLSGTFIEAKWKGYVEIKEPINKTFTISHPGINLELIIDGRSVWRGRGNANISDKIYTHSFTPGQHKIVFLASPDSDDKPGELQVSIKDDAKNYKFNELTSILQSLGDFDSIYCGVEKSTAKDHTVKLELKDQKKPTVLFLTSYKNVVWDFENRENPNLLAIVTSAKNSSEKIKNLPRDIPVYNFFQLSNSCEMVPTRGLRSINDTFKMASLQILALTGKLPSGFTGVKQAKTIHAPEISLNHDIYTELGFSDISADYNVFIEYPKDIDFVFNPEPTKYIDYGNNPNTTRTRPLEPTVQRESWAESLGVTHIPTDKFVAYYFDIFNPGKPQYSGVVENIFIESPERLKRNRSRTAFIDQHDIIPENFGAFWIGNIEVKKDTEMIIDLDFSNGEVRLLIDDQVIKDKKVTLSKGLHKIEIEYVNNWHTYHLYFSITEDSWMSQSWIKLVKGWREARVRYLSWDAIQYQFADFMRKI